MNQAVRAGQNLHKCAKIRDLDDLAFINSADFRFPGKVLYHFNGGFAFLLGIGRNFNQTGIVNFDTGTGLTLNSTDDFSTGADDFADFIGVDLNGTDGRRIW